LGIPKPLGHGFIEIPQPQQGKSKGIPMPQGYPRIPKPQVPYSVEFRSPKQRTLGNS